MTDVVIVGAKRTAIGSMLGQFTGVPTPTLGAAAIGAAVCAGVSLGKESGSGKLPHFDWKGKLFGKEKADG